MPTMFDPQWEAVKVRVGGDKLMSRTVIILGAGASVSAGAPVMYDFLNVARDTLTTSSTSYQSVRKGIAALDSVFAKSSLDVFNIESVFAAFEMAGLCKRLGSLSTVEVNALAPSIRELIVLTLERKMQFVWENAKSVPHPPAAYGKLVQAIAPKLSGPSDTSFITFNYDLGLDYSLRYHGIDFDYCLEDKPKAVCHLLKLHGSINWMRDATGKIVSTDKGYPYDPALRGAATANVSMEFSKHVKDPVIVPPTWSKSGHYKELENVWQSAAKHLSEAEDIFIIGYSLPPSDYFFRYLFALGTAGESHIRRVWVFNPDEKVKARYVRLLGPKTKEVFELFINYFDACIPYISSAINGSITADQLRDLRFYCADCRHNARVLRKRTNRA